MPPTPPIDIGAIEPELSRANIALGRLDGIADVVPNPDLFVTMYVRKEAVLSSRIEGTQASLSDVLEDEAGIEIASHPADVSEVRNYVRALNSGLKQLKNTPLSLRLIKSIHAELMRGVRGQEKEPGEFRRSQNWIGRDGSPLSAAAFVPPAHTELLDHLSVFEKYIRAEDATPVLVRAGATHVQFETIHPFLDGNGRLGRLLITFMLCEREVLSRPLLYLSAYFERNKNEYYNWLTRVREEGDWEGWLRFYLNGIEQVAGDAVETARRVLALQQKHRQLVVSRLPSKPNATRLLESLFLRPTVTPKTAAAAIEVSVPTAYTLIKDLVRIGLLHEVTGRERDRVFRYREYLATLTPS